MTKLKKKVFFFKKMVFYFKFLKVLHNVFLLLYKDKTVEFEKVCLKNVGWDRF